MIGTARPELLDRRRSWGGGRRNASLVWLDALSPGEAAEMLDELVPGELSGETRAGLVERAEGNPFFLEELLAAVVETGTVVEELPDSVQAILSARVDTLASGDKSALQAASVIGRVFWSGPTLELVGGGPVAWTRPRRSRLHPPPVDLVDRRRDGVHLQARADTGGGLRQRAQGAPRQAPCR